MLIQNRLYLILNFMVGITGMMFSQMINPAHATSCLVYPSEYAYKDDSVTRTESPSANCRSYPIIHGLPAGIHSMDYIRCNGTQLKLADSNLGSEQFSSSSHYQWSDGSDGQLLFIFPTRVSLITITLHYYSDSVRGLPRLTFYAVPDDFEIWDVPTTTYPKEGVAAVLPGGEPADRRSVNITVNLYTKKVLMYKYTGTFPFAVSEVDFFTCAVITTSTLTMTYNPTTSAQTKSDDRTMFTEIQSIKTEKVSNSFTNPVSIMTSFTTDNMTETVQPKSNTGITAIGVSITILIILSMVPVIIIIILAKRKSNKQKLYTDSPYSTLSGEIGKQIQSTQIDPADSLYDQVDLRSSTGQTGFIPKSEIANINNPNLTPHNVHPTYSIVYDNAEHSSTLDIANQATTSQLSLHESTSKQPIYAAVDKTKKKFKRQRKKDDPQCKGAEKGSLISPYRHEASSPRTIEDLYIAIKEKPKDCELKGEENTPPVPPHTVEELYTAVQKKTKRTMLFNGDGSKDEVLPHTVDQNRTACRDMYTAVMKKPKDGSAYDTEAAPPIPPHTVEELYTAVMKKPKGNTEEAPPIPP